MSLPVPPPRFEIGRVIERLAGAVQRNFGPFMLCSLVLTGVPLVVVGLLQSRLVSDTSPSGAISAGLTGLIAFPVSLVSSAVLQAAVIHGAVNDLNGRPASLGDCLSTGLRLVLPMIGIAVLVGIVFVFGFLLFIVPGIFAALAFSVSVPVEVVERHGVVASMSRSFELTRNHRWAILGLFVLFVILSIIAGTVSNVLAAFLGNLTPLGFVRASFLVFTPLSQSLMAMIGAAGVASVYYELRNIKEGIGPETLAAVFD